jgi:segregation and condensation protein A
LLLPRPQLDEQGNEIDPREELIRHLMEYKKYKSVIDDLHKIEEGELQKEKRGNVVKELRHLAELSNVEAELQDVEMFKLLTLFEKLMKRFEDEKNKPVHQVIQYPYTVEGQKEFILSELATKPRMAFTELFQSGLTRVGLIFNFLAILEMLAIGQLNIQVGEGYNNFWISMREAVEMGDTQP